MHRESRWINISSGCPDISHKLQTSSEGANSPLQSLFSKEVSLLKSAYILLLFTVGLFYCHFNLQHRPGLITKCSARQSYYLGDHFTTHLSFTDDKECVTTSTLSNDVITRPVECLKQESIKICTMPEDNTQPPWLNSTWWVNFFPFSILSGTWCKFCPTQNGSVGWSQVNMAQ